MAWFHLVLLLAAPSGGAVASEAGDAACLSGGSAASGMGAGVCGRAAEEAGQAEVGSDDVQLLAMRSQRKKQGRLVSDQGKASASDPAREADFGASVLFLEPSGPVTSNIPEPCREQATSNQQLVDCVGWRVGARLYPQEDGGCADDVQFSEERYAILLKPGDFGDLTIRVGYYTQVMGLGEDRTKVTVGEAKVEWGLFPPNYQTQQNFWRSVENFKQRKALTWQVSQAAPARNLEVPGGYSVTCSTGEGCYGSGGYFADVAFSGGPLGSMGQQWFQRNCDMTSIGSTFNTVSVGIAGGAQPLKDMPWVSSTPFIAEKPHMVANSDGTFSLYMFATEQDKQGASQTGPPLRKSYLITKGMLVSPGEHTGADLTRQLAQNQVLIFLPGIHSVAGTIEISSDDSVLYGLGMATLQQTSADLLITVESGLSHVTVVGLMFQSEFWGSAGFLRWGGSRQATLGAQGNASNASLLQASASRTKSCSKADYTNFIQDVFPVVGGRVGGLVGTAMEINDDCVIVDHTWIWAADHGLDCCVGYDKGRLSKGLVVNGAGVLVYGGFVEHVTGEHVLWNGEAGKMFFLQTELPYLDKTANPPPSKLIFPSGSAPFVINAATFEAWGLGLYVVFDYPWELLYAIQVPPYNGQVKIKHSLFWFITSQAQFDAGAIKNVLGEEGNAVGNCGPNNQYQTQHGTFKICPHYP